MSDAFSYQVVERKKPRKQKRKGNAGNSTETSQSNFEAHRSVLSPFLQDFDAVWKQAMKITNCPIPRVNSIIALGIGKVSVYQNPRDQLVLLRHVAKLCRLQETQVTVYDPAFEADDVNYIRECCNYIASANQPDLKVAEDDGCILFYLPHAPRLLIERILAINWSDDRRKMPNFLIVGNHLSEYPQSILTKADIEAVPHIFKAAHTFHQFDIADHSNLAFHYLAIQWASSSVG